MVSHNPPWDLKVSGESAFKIGRINSKAKVTAATTTTKERKGVNKHCLAALRLIRLGTVPSAEVGKTVIKGTTNCVGTIQENVPNLKQC